MFENKGPLRLRMLLQIFGVLSFPLQGAAATSIVFIIDNSGSMSVGESGSPSDGFNDPQEARFTVVRTLLDTLAAKAPSTEVGMVIFTRRLQFDDRDDAYFKSAFPGDTSQHDAFVPLTALNRIFPNGKSGSDTLKELLSYTGHGNLVHATKFPASRPNTNLYPLNLRDGTDITLGFQAALVAMQDSKSDKSDQYLIFLSDGLPLSVDTPRIPLINDFINGAADPTTFTVFFNAATTNPIVPNNIQAMTDHIKANGYSTSNPKSTTFAIDQPGTQLQTLLQDQILNSISAPIKSIRMGNRAASSQWKAENAAMTFTGSRLRFNISMGLSAGIRSVDARGMRITESDRSLR